MTLSLPDVAVTTGLLCGTVLVLALFLYRYLMVRLDVEVRKIDARMDDDANDIGRIHDNEYVPSARPGAAPGLKPIPHPDDLNGSSSAMDPSLFGDDDEVPRTAMVEEDGTPNEHVPIEEDE